MMFDAAGTTFKPHSCEKGERHLKKHWQLFQGLPTSEIGRALVATRLEEIAEQSGPMHPTEPTPPCLRFSPGRWQSGLLSPTRLWAP
jgi:hypothetical protein